jgi:hypothetical protein
MFCIHSRPETNQRKGETEQITKGLLFLSLKSNIASIGWMPVESSDSILVNAIRYPSSEPLDERIQSVDGLALIPLDSITSIKIEPQLTVLDGKAVALCLLSIQSESQTFPNLWCDPIKSTVESQQDILIGLRHWIRPFHRDFVGLDDNSNLFYLTDNLMPFEENTFMSRWPSNLPQPRQDSALYKIGEIGMGLISTVLGNPTKNVYREII